jgi:hypothetical protein
LGVTRETGFRNRQKGGIARVTTRDELVRELRALRKGPGATVVKLAACPTVCAALDASSPLEARARLKAAVDGLGGSQEALALNSAYGFDLGHKYLLSIRRNMHGSKIGRSESRVADYEDQAIEALADVLITGATEPDNPATAEFEVPPESDTLAAAPFDETDAVHLRSLVALFDEWGRHDLDRMQRARDTPLLDDAEYYAELRISKYAAEKLSQLPKADLRHLSRSRALSETIDAILKESLSVWRLKAREALNARDYVEILVRYASQEISAEEFRKSSKAIEAATHGFWDTFSDESFTLEDRENLLGLLGRFDNARAQGIQAGSTPEEI